MNCSKNFNIGFPIFVLAFFAVIVNYLNAQYSNMHEFSIDATMSNPEYNQFATDGTILYGMTSYGGVNNRGVIFKINKDGTGFQKLMDFDGTSKGSYPKGSLTLSGSVLYGMTNSGGTYNCGVIFKINTDGTGFQKLLDFDGASKGSYPNGGLTISGSVLYGTTYNGGANGYGVLFKINTDGTNYLKLLDFGVGILAAYPTGTLALSGSTLYGMTVYAGSNAKGSIYKISTSGTGFTRIYNFDGTASGANPYGSLTISGTTLYGMTTLGGANNLGCIFRITTSGSNFTKLLDFDGANNGSKPYGSLFLSGTTLYGMTTYGGTNDRGCVFSIKTDGTEFWRKWNLGDTIWGGYENNGNYPRGSLILIGNELFGMTSGGGYKNAGTIFRVYDYSIRASDGVYRKLRDCYPALQGTHLIGDFATDGTSLYGTAWDGGTNNKGAVFKINTDGSNFQDIYHFNSDANGYTPVSVILSGSKLFGMTHDGGSYNAGIIFKMNTDGTGFQKLADFDSVRAAVPYGKLLLNGTILYGTSNGGGANNKGAIFKINTDGTGFQKLLDFDGTSKGSYPLGTLTLSGSTLYGTTYLGGTNNLGVIFKINTDGTNYQKLLDFDGTNKGANPCGGSLTQIGNSLYGMTKNGGTMNRGVIFKINTDGTGFQKIADFTITNGASPQYTSLTYYNSSLYGTTFSGGTYGAGVIFKINPDGTGMEILYSLDGSIGAKPANSLLAINSTLYGTTIYGGANNIGVVFKYDLVNLQISATGGNLTCSVPKININATSNISDVTYTWSGPNGFSSTLQNPEVSAPGDYIVTVTYGEQSKIDTAIVTQNITAPGVTATGGMLTCAITSTSITGSSQTSGVTYSWTGPENYNSTEQTAVTTLAGNYTVTAYATVNGCTSSATITVTQDTITPKDVKATVSDILSCITPSVFLSGTSSTANVSFNWFGPNGYTSSEEQPLVNIPGNYVLSVRKSDNGCVSSTNVTVVSDTLVPENVKASASGVLTCNIGSIVLHGASSLSGVTYTWSGPNEFTSSLQNPVVNKPGKYILTAKFNSNGCYSKDSITVHIDTIPPANINAITSGSLDCNNIFVTLTGSSSTPGAKFLWISPDNSEFSGNMMFAISGGVYRLVVTNPGNGCQGTTSVEVLIDTISPVSTIIQPLTQPEALTTNILSALTSGDVSYSWDYTSSDTKWLILSGNTSKDLTYQAGNAGTNATFMLSLTNNVNGCSGTSTIALTALQSPLKVYPNPFTDKAYVEFTPTQNNRTTIELYGGSGTLIMVLFDADVLASQFYRVTLESTNLLNGTYYLVIKTSNPNEISTYTLILVK